MHPAPPETFAKYLYRKRMSRAAELGRKVTQSDMADELNVSHNTYYCWEAARRTPTPETEQSVRDKLGA